MSLYEVVRDKARFFGKTLFAPKIGIIDQIGPKLGFFKFNEQFSH